MLFKRFKDIVQSACKGFLKTGFFHDLLHPLLHALIGELGLLVFVKCQAKKFAVFNSFGAGEIVAICRPATDEFSANAVKFIFDHLHPIHKIVGIEHLIAQSKNSHRFAVKPGSFKPGKEVEPQVVVGGILPDVGANG